MKDTARLIVTQRCMRDCAYCCNKYPHIQAQMRQLSDVSELDPYRTVILTGGEPLLEFDRTLHLARELRDKGKTVYLYTSIWTAGWIRILDAVDGVCYTIHPEPGQRDIFMFHEFQRASLMRQRGQTHRLCLDPKISDQLQFVPAAWSEVKLKWWRPEDDARVPEGEDLFVL